jgi:hypothetical protein
MGVDMSASARLLVLMTPEERAAIDAKARAAGMSAGELMRRGAAAYEIGSEAEAAELRVLLDLFEETHPAALTRIDAAIAETARHLSHLRSSPPEAPRSASRP